MKTFYLILQIKFSILLAVDLFILFGALFLYSQSPEQNFTGLFVGAFLAFFALMLLLEFVSNQKMKA